ncbi:hypothetical protein [Desulfonatronovibrio hydrogenovorans]|uniref:hypothetical protein n=1 Tax=Desulfonatronovibrio hydrogenovorans TaxID=53245 RepID=UPI00048DA788|nr:hypothetical protein [Desulfonatronovibrio hydrogenovorans]
MPIRFLKLGPALKWVTGGTAVLAMLAGGAWAYHSWKTGQLESQVIEIRDSRDRWKDAARSHESRAEKMEQQYKQARQSVRDLEQELSAQEAHYESLREQIRQAPDEEDGPVAPVLRDTLEALQ